MLVICDADGLIKLHKAGILLVLADLFKLILSEQVFQEAVEAGKKGGHADAFELEKCLPGKVTVIQKPEHPRAAAMLGGHLFGAGERSSLSLYFHEKASGILSDDRKFLNFLGENQIPFLTPAETIIQLVENERLSPGEARKALKNLEPMIPTGQYQAALKLIKQGGKHG